MTITVEEHEGVWWFNDPQRGRFVSIGANHLQSDCWLAPYNREAMVERYGDDLATADWDFNPQGQALGRLVDATLGRLNAMGFNSLGLHTYDVPAELFADQMYYLMAIESFPLGSRFKFREQRFPDVFSPEFEALLADTVRAVVAEHGAYERFLGYAFSDIPRWYFYQGQRLGEQPVHPWVKDMVSQPADSPGAQACRAVIPGASAESITTREQSDAILAAVVEHWYQMHVKLIREHDSERLIFGDKLHSPHQLPEWFPPILKKYVDVVLIQWYTPFEDQRQTLDALHALAGKPILNGDSCFGCAKPPKQTKVKGYKVESQAAVGQAYADYLEAAMSRPYMLGWHHCGIMEQWDGGKRVDWAINENGFWDPFENRYEEFAGPVERANRQAHAWHARA